MAHGEEEEEGDEAGKCGEALEGWRTVSITSWPEKEGLLPEFPQGKATSNSFKRGVYTGGVRLLMNNNTLASPCKHLQIAQTNIYYDIKQLSLRTTQLIKVLNFQGVIS